MRAKDAHTALFRVLISRVPFAFAGWTLRGFPAVSIRIGLSTGMALVGNLGSQERLRYRTTALPSTAPCLRAQHRS